MTSILRLRSSASEPTNAFVEIRGIVVDGVRIAPKPDGKVRLNREPRTVVFEIGPPKNNAGRTGRVRMRLDNDEDQWRERPGDMRLCLRFLDGHGDQVAETIFKVVGQSENWTGDLRTAAFRLRHESVVVPPNARSFWVVMSSAGPPDAVGVYAISDLAIKSSSSNTIDFAAGDTLEGTAPKGWMRDGLRPSMATTFEHGIAIFDDDLTGHAEWHTIKEQAIPVTAGEKLKLDWKEAFSLGLAGQASIQYVDLPSGYYRFRLNELSVTGQPTERELSLALEVPLAFWRTPWFWVSIATFTLAALIGGWRYATWRRLQLQMQRLEQQRAVDRERLRIAQDIHDDLGARVTQISLLSAFAQRKTSAPDDIRADFGTISQMTRELVSALYETVWAVNPENDNLDALANYLCQMSNQLCAQSQLRCRLDVPELPTLVTIRSSARHNIIMAVKEAVHNVIKHARASEMRLRIEFKDLILTIWIQDDGSGFDPSNAAAGNGLANLNRRMQDIGGSLMVESERGTGTRIRLQLPFSPK